MEDDNRAVTMADLRQLLAGLATKADLAGMATKSDLSGLATKADISRLDTRITDLDTRITVLDTRITDLDTKTGAQFEDMRSRFDRLIEAQQSTGKAVRKLRHLEWDMSQVLHTVQGIKAAVDVQNRDIDQIEERLLALEEQGTPGPKPRTGRSRPIVPR
jgi:chromosome segregation ATPase